MRAVHQDDVDAPHCVRSHDFRRPVRTGGVRDTVHKREGEIDARREDATDDGEDDAERALPRGAAAASATARTAAVAAATARRAHREVARSRGAIERGVVTRIVTSPDGELARL